jgi:hypothetical protein
MINYKIAIFNNTGHSVNLQRQILLANKIKHEVILDRNKFKNQLKLANSILIADDVDISILFTIFYKIKFLYKNRINLNFIFLELYTISYKALINEVFSYLLYDNFSFIQFLKQIYFTPSRLIRIILFRLILKSKSCTIFLPSSLRIKFISQILIKEHIYKRVRNLLINNTASEYNNDLYYQPYSYLFIAGNIYYLNDFKIICQFAFKSNIKIVVSSKTKLSNHLTKKFENTIIQTGPLSHSKIIELTKNCLAGIAVFTKDNINQNFAASSKLYEYAAYGKPIIVSRVAGVESEVQEFSIKNIIYIDQLNTYELDNIPLINNDFNSSFLYENDLNLL